MSKLSKKIDERFQLFLSHIPKETIKICYIEAENMAADVMTKALSPPNYRQVSRKHFGDEVIPAGEWSNFQRGAVMVGRKYTEKWLFFSSHLMNGYSH